MLHNRVLECTWVLGRRPPLQTSSSNQFHLIYYVHQVVTSGLSILCFPWKNQTFNPRGKYSCSTCLVVACRKLYPNNCLCIIFEWENISTTFFITKLFQQSCQWCWEDGISDMKWNKLFLENLKLKLEEDLVQQARN
jgi:hypothetical protein